jgi:hypothetical protein
MGLIAPNREMYGRRETSWYDVREVRSGQRRKERNCAKHHSSQNENEKDLIREMGFWV